MPKAPAAPRPYLKWAGGKRQLLPVLRAHLPADWAQRVYYEPFLGAGALLLELRPAQAVVSDYNAMLMLTYQVVRDQAEELIRRLEEHQARHCKDYYYQIREMDRQEGFDRLPEVERAARLIYLNRTCYNGLYRVNAKGLFNVPFGRYQNPAICEAEVLRAVSAYLNGNQVALGTGDFAAAVAGAGANAFVYFDPPYHSPDKTNFTGYQAGGFGEAEQTRLRNTFTALTQAGARCLLSNSDTPFIRTLYAGYHWETVPARRFINADSANRGPVDEILIWNW